VAQESKRNPAAPADAPGPDTQPALDLAGQSLARALRLSFAILSVIIVMLLAAYFARGLFTVESDEMAIILRLGKTDAQHVKAEGFHRSWPYPFDEIVRVWTVSRALEVDTFWPKMSEKQKEEAIEKPKESFRFVVGAEDGYMLTGDLNILQGRWKITYQIQTDSRGKTDKAAVIKYYNMVGVNREYDRYDTRRYENERRLVKLLLQSAVIREIGRLGVIEAYTTEKERLVGEVKRTIGKMFDELDCGLMVTEISLIDIAPPEKAKRAFEAVSEAKQARRTERERADEYAQTKLIRMGGRVVGPKLGKAIGQMWEARRARAAINPENEAEVKRLDERIATLRRNISDLFESDELGGDAKNILRRAKAYKENIVKRTKGDAEAFGEILALSPNEKKILLDRKRIEAFEKVLKNCYEKFVWRPIVGETKGTLEIWINRRPELIREQRKVQQYR